MITSIKSDTRLTFLWYSELRVHHSVVFLRGFVPMQYYLAILFRMIILQWLKLVLFLNYFWNQGNRGQTGATGKTGQPGTQGTPGTDGEPGVPGDDGEPVSFNFWKTSLKCDKLFCISYSKATFSHNKSRLKGMIQTQILRLHSIYVEKKIADRDFSSLKPSLIWNLFNLPSKDRD